jgi:glycosyltransferase involved in cell wall biosynthesis
MYNASDTIEDCILSILNQTYKCYYQIIVINDGSTDDSLDVVYCFSEKYKSDVIEFVVLSMTNHGVAEARNVGLNIAKNDFLAFLDSDDRWLPNKTQLQMDYLLSHPSVEMIAGIYGSDDMYNLKKEREEMQITIHDQVFKNYFASQTVLFRRSILEKSGLFNSNMRYAEEGLFFNNMVSNGICILFNQKVAEGIINKKRWGEFGLSGNLLKMEQGELFNIKQAYKNKYIGFCLYCCAVIFSIIKFLRRILITKIHCYGNKKSIWNI